MQLCPLVLAVGLTTAGISPSVSAIEGQLHIRIEGQAKAAGLYATAPGTRLSEVMMAAQPSPRAYLLGTALLRQRARLEQARSRAGLKHDLRLLHETLDPELKRTTVALLEWLDSHEPNGRVTLGVSNMYLMQARRMEDPTVEGGDILILPGRPETIKVMGAVVAECELPHRPARDALDYLRDCPIAPLADRNDLYVIQPNAHVQRLGIAMWNRADPQPVAPGGVIYVPLRETYLQTIDPNFNAEFAAFIATQALNP